MGIAHVLDTGSSIRPSVGGAMRLDYCVMSSLSTLFLVFSKKNEHFLSGRQNVFFSMCLQLRYVSGLQWLNGLTDKISVLL